MSYQLASHDDLPAAAGRAHSVEFAFKNIVGESPAISSTVDFARRVAGRRLTTALLVGETGTGKELFARGIHYAGPDPGEPFVAVNCPAIPPALLESELFGHERGAFTDARSMKKGLLELAGGGTLFLDEITDLPLDLQPKLLRALEERRVRRLGGVREVEIRCRLVAATNRSLEQEVAEGKFREDLFYRLNVLRLELPPLRDREGDVELLAKHFAQAVALEHGIGAKEISPRALQVLRAHDWPGNVRELKNVIQRAALLGNRPRIHADDLVISQRQSPHASPGSEVPPRAIVIPDRGRSMAEIEAEAIMHTMAITSGNKSAASRMLGISRPTLLRKLGKYGIATPQGGGV